MKKDIFKFDIKIELDEQPEDYNFKPFYIKNENYQNSKETPNAISTHKKYFKIFYFLFARILLAFSLNGVFYATLLPLYKISASLFHFFNINTILLIIKFI